MTVIDERIRAFLGRQRVARLGTASNEAEPHVVPICFCVIDDSLYVAIDEKPKTNDVSRLKRLRNIAENPRVAVAVDVYDDSDWSRLAFVLLRGTARVLVGGNEHTRAVAALRERYVQYRAMALEDRPVIAVDVERVTAWGNLA